MEKKTLITRRSMLQLTAAGGAAAAFGIGKPAILRAQGAYPDRPVTMVVPFATGGYNDRMARAFAPFLQEALGQPVTIINREGGNAILGHSYLLQQPNDGYHILCTSAAPYIPLSVYVHNAPYTVDDFWMINLPSRDLTLGATSSESDIESFDQVLDRLREDPSSVSLGIQPASADLVNVMLMLDAAGISREGLRIVTYDGGGPARNAAAGGHVDVAFVGGEGFLPLKERIKPLVLFSDEQMEGFDDIPLAGEIGQAQGFEVTTVPGSLRGWAVATKLKDEEPEVYEIIRAAVQQAQENPACIEVMQTQQLSHGWYGEEASNEAYKSASAVLQEHVDLLKPS